MVSWAPKLAEGFGAQVVGCFGNLSGASKSVQVVFNGTEAVVVLTLIILIIASPVGPLLLGFKLQGLLAGVYEVWQVQCCTVRGFKVQDFQIWDFSRFRPQGL